MRLAATLIVLGLLGCKSPPAYKELTKEEQIAQAKKRHAEHLIRVREARKKQAAMGPRKLFYVSGCERGEVMLPKVNVWSQPGGIAPGVRVVGQLSGEGRPPHKCRGAVVILLRRLKTGGRNWVQVEAVVGGKTGWFTSLFVGDDYDTKHCKHDFSGYPEALARCLGKQPE